MATQSKRAKFSVETNELYKFAALLNSGGVNKPWPMAATQLLKQVLHTTEDGVRREPTDEEIAKLIERGYKLTG